MDRIMNAANKPEYTLCAGSFLFLVLAAKNDKARNRNQNGIDEPNAIKDFIGISGMQVEPFCSDRDAATDISKFKRCQKEAPKWLLFGSEEYINAMKEKVEEEYKNTLNSVIVWAHKYLDLERNGDWLCKALLELVYFDKEVDPKDKIFAGPEGQLISFKSLFEASEIHIQSFLLGLWYFVVKENKLNRSGENTISELKSVGREDSGRGVAFFVGKRCEFSQNVRILNLEKLVVSDKEKIVAELRQSEIEEYRPRIPGANNMIALSDEAIALPDNGFDEYLDSVYDSYSEVSTLIYHKEPRSFKSLYVCNDVLRPVYKQHWSPSADEKNAAYNRIKELSFPIIKENDYRFLMILGTGGLGKSMMLNNILLDAIDNYYEYRMFPVPVSLRDYDGKHTDFFDFLYDAVDSFGARISKERFNDLLIAGKVLFLFDGLDEIARKYKQSFDLALERFIKGHRRNYFIISSRPGEAENAFGRFKKARLLPLTYVQSLEVVNKLDEDIYPVELKTSFIQTLEGGLYSTHKEFVENPLLLNMMLMTYKQKADIPQEMHKFYEKVYETLFTEHDSIKLGYNREYKTGLKQDEFAAYFEEFCFLTYQDDKYDLSDDECKYFFEDMDIVKRERPSFGWKDFIDDLVHCICIMYEEGEEKKYHFIHRSIQEYFCARYFAKLPDKDLYEIAMYFEDTDSKHGDSTFDMLYAMKPLSVEEEVFLPYMESIFEKQDDEYSEEDVYKRFLCTNYLLLHFDIGEVPVSEENLTFPVPFLYRYIGEKKELVADYFGTYLDMGNYDYEEFYMQRYVLFDVDYSNREIDEGVFVLEHGEHHIPVIPEEVPEDYLRKFDMPETCGVSYEVNVEDILYDNSGVYDELAEQLLDKKFPLYVEFKRKRKIFRRI